MCYNETDAKLTFGKDTGRAVSVAAIVGALAFAGHRLRKAPAKGTMPTPESIATAMKAQEKPGIALEVRYSWETIKTNPARMRTVVDSYYVRTPTAIFLKERYINRIDPKADPYNLLITNRTTTALYNRSTGQYREMAKWDNGPAEGKVTYDT